MFNEILLNWKIQRVVEISKNGETVRQGFVQEPIMGPFVFII